MAQIGHDRIAHILRQGQLGPAITFAVHAQTASLPVNVLEFQEGHFPRTQTQAGEQQQDRVVASPNGSAAIDLTQQSAYLIGCNPSGNRGHRPVRHARDDRGQIQLDLPAVACVLQERAQRRRQELRSLQVQVPRLALDKPDNIARTQTRQRHGPGAEAVLEEPGDKWHVVDDRRLRQNALLAQVLLVCLHAPFGRCEWTCRYLFTGNHPLATEKLDEMTERGRVSPVRSSLSIPKSQKPRRMFGRDAVGWHFRLFDPSTKARSEHYLPVNVTLGVSLPTQ